MAYDGLSIERVYKCTILKIIDGDTVDVDVDLGFGMKYAKQRVRLLGIDTPESRTRDKVEKFYGMLAKEYLKGKLVVGEQYKLRTTKSKGKFGRILGEFFTLEDDAEVNQVVEINVNEALVKAHHAVEYHGQSKEDIQEGHLVNRQRLAEKGITP